MFKTWKYLISNKLPANTNFNTHIKHSNTKINLIKNAITDKKLPNQTMIPKLEITY